MKRAVRLYLVVLSVLLLLSACAPKPKIDAGSSTGPALWKVTSSNGGELYLFGSIHAAEGSLYPLPEQVMKAFESCDALAVEFDTTGMGEEAAKELYTRMLLTDGTAITDHVDAKTYESMKAILEDAGSYLSLFDAFGPVLWETMLESAAMEKAGLSTEHGVDSYFLDLAHQNGKEILEVESFAFQAELLTNEEAIEDAKELLPLLTERFEDCAKYYRYLFDAYAKGDMDALEFVTFGKSAAVSTTGDRALDELILAMEEDDADDSTAYSVAARNKNMARAASEYLALGKKVFFVVGAAHMIGPDGLVELLSQMGFTVERA